MKLLAKLKRGKETGEPAEPARFEPGNPIVLIETPFWQFLATMHL